MINFQGFSSNSMMSQVIDWPLWLTHVGNNKEIAEQTFHMIAQDIENNRPLIIEFYMADDLPRLKAITHKMKGALEYCGLPRLEIAMKSIEGAAKQGNKQEVDKWYPEVLDAMEEVQKAYQEWLNLRAMVHILEQQLKQKLWKVK